MKLSHLQITPDITLEKDELYRSDISDQQKLIKKLKAELRAEEAKITRLYGLDAKSRGLEPAYIDSSDLIKIIEDLLANKSTITNAFERHEITEGKCKGWANRTKRYPLDEDRLKSALNALAMNANIIVMQKYKVLDHKDIGRSTAYSAALTKLKKQLAIAHTLQDKDNELINKDIVIAARDAKIEELKQELVRNKSFDWHQQALTLRQEGISVKEIAARLNKSRTTVSNYLNSPINKSQLLKRSIQA